MGDNPAATSILELLVYANPAVTHVAPTSKTNSRNPKWHTPKEIRKWTEANDFKILQTSFGGGLLEEARQEGRNLPSYPRIGQGTRREIRDEDDTRELIHDWNKKVVDIALEPIQHVYHPAIWQKGNPPRETEYSEAPPEPEKERTQPSRQCSNHAKGPKMQVLKWLRADSGSIAGDQEPAHVTSTAVYPDQERFPKEYKPAGKWRSEWIETKLLNGEGGWQKGKTTHGCAWPIKQAFTYCIQHMCRYGCILTCREAFIFRVRPREDESDRSADTAFLRKRLAENGLMEYISVPWTNHCTGDARTYETWTVNLALWFFHVLAGNHFEAAWRPGDLKDEIRAVFPHSEGSHDAGLVDNGDGHEGGQTAEGSGRDEDEDGDIETLRSVETDYTESSGLKEQTWTEVTTPKRKRGPVEDGDEERLEAGYSLSFSKRVFFGE